MIDSLLFPATLIAALGSGLIAGTFFAFSTFVMSALGRLPAAQAIAAMQSINITVINPVFLGGFMGTAALGALLAVMALFNWQAPGAAYLLPGSALYLIGTFGVTMAFNVPLNNALAAVAPDSTEGARLWTHYLRTWTQWNHVRMAAALLAAASFTLALR